MSVHLLIILYSYSVIGMIIGRKECYRFVVVEISLFARRHLVPEGFHEIFIVDDLLAERFENERAQPVLAQS